jgi:outer membrane protein
MVTDDRQFIENGEFFGNCLRYNQCLEYVHVPCYNGKVKLCQSAERRDLFVLNLSKKQVKIVSLTVAMFFVLGVVGIALSQTGKISAAASNSSNIGLVDKQMLVSKHPDLAKAQEAMQAEVDQAKKDFEEKTKDMNDQAKKDYYTQIQQRLTVKQQELIDPVVAKVDAEIKNVADAKGLAVVMDKASVVYGGVDITDDVAKKLATK